MKCKYPRCEEDAEPKTWYCSNHSNLIDFCDGYDYAYWLFAYEEVEKKLKKKLGKE